MLKIHPKKALTLNSNLIKKFELETFKNITNEYFIHKLTYKFSKDLYENNRFVNYISNLDKIKIIDSNNTSTLSK